MLLLLLLRAWALSPPLTSKNQCPNVSYLNDPGGFALLKKKYGMNFPYMMNNQFSIFLLPFEHQDTVTLFFFSLKSSQPQTFQMNMAKRPQLIPYWLEFKGTLKPVKLKD